VSRLLPRGLAAQLTALLLLALAGGQLAAFWILTGERRGALETLRHEQVVERLTLLVRVLLAAPEDAWARLIAAAGDDELALRLEHGPPAATAGELGRGLAGLVARRLGLSPDRVRVELEPAGRSLPGLVPWPAREDDEDERGIWGRRWAAANVAVGLAPDRWLRATVRLPPQPPGFGGPTLVALVTTALALILAVLVTARRITRPVRALALAADRLGRGEAVEPLPERGPDELRRATRAFNTMQARLRRFVDDRTRILAALGHDLRTPITALRLRAEFVEEDEARERLLATLDEMQRMVEATLAFARDEAGSEAAREVDLAALVEGVCEDLRELGREVAVEPGPRLVARVRPLALRRALRNLVENAVAYGGRARVTLRREAGEAVVTVEDDGPGVPEDQLERVFEPFVRLEGSRSRETGGVGLGLAIARSVVRAHGGEVTLTNRPGGGLTAMVRLPLGAGAALSRS
jgi:signal transduction histidine kinase